MPKDFAPLTKFLHSRGGQRGLISACTAGGMGVAAILEGVKAQTPSKTATEEIGTA